MVIQQRQDETFAGGESLQVADLGLDTAALDGPDRVASHFWQGEECRGSVERGRGNA